MITSDRHPDLNLLVTLDVLLTEGSVARAARRLGLSASAMSRALARLREATGDPLLVRAGRGLVPTPRALALRDPVTQLVQDAHAVLRPEQAPDLEHLERTFTLRTSDGFTENYGPALLERIGREAPGVRLRFMQKVDKDSAGLRDGTVALETGVVGDAMGPELRAQALFRDRFVGVVRSGHPLSEKEVSLDDYVRASHVAVFRRSGGKGGHVDAAMEALGLARQIATIVAGFSTALSLARASDLVATVPERHTARLREGMHSFPLPVAVPQITVSLLWHPRMQADPAHRWLRAVVLAICGAAAPG
jgi:DNA-binding transcriptional LysR family regulator